MISRLETLQVLRVIILRGAFKEAGLLSVPEKSPHGSCQAVPLFLGSLDGLDLNRTTSPENPLLPGDQMSDF